MVGGGGCEPPTSWSQTMRAKPLRHTPPSHRFEAELTWYPWRDSNPRSRLRRPVLYPLSYRGTGVSYYYHAILSREKRQTVAVARLVKRFVTTQPYNDGRNQQRNPMTINRNYLSAYSPPKEITFFSLTTFLRCASTCPRASSSR